MTHGTTGATLPSAGHLWRYDTGGHRLVESVPALRDDVQAWTSSDSLRPCTSSDASPATVGRVVRKCEGMCTPAIRQSGWQLIANCYGHSGRLTKISLFYL